MKYSAALTLIAYLNVVAYGAALSAPQPDGGSEAPELQTVLPPLLQPTDVWGSVGSLPPGSRLRLVFHDGSELTGTVVETGPDRVALNNNQPGRAGVTLPRGSSLHDTLTFRRGDVATVSVLTVPTRYRANGAPNAGAVRHVVTALGSGKKIDLASSNGSEPRRVRIQSIEPTGFTYVEGFRGAVKSMAYGDVSEVKPAGLHPAVKFAMFYFGGALVLAVIGLLALAGAQGLG